MKLLRQKSLKRLTNNYIHRLADKQVSAQELMLAALEIIKKQEPDEG